MEVTEGKKARVSDRQRKEEGKIVRGRSKTIPGAAISDSFASKATAFSALFSFCFFLIASADGLEQAV